MDRQAKRKVVIDRSHWRTGKDGEHRTGMGKTTLRNEYDFLCCLGFICEDVIGSKLQLDLAMPSDIEIDIPELTDVEIDSHDGEENRIDSYKANRATAINDNVETTPQEKEQQLLTLFDDSQYRLEFVNDYTIYPIEG